MNHEMKMQQQNNSGKKESDKPNTGWKSVQNQER